MKKAALTRQTLLEDDVSEWAQKYQGVLDVVSPAELQSKLDATIDTAPERGNVWVFAYGSLLWNPAIDFVEECVGRLHGYHRSFCLYSKLGRGSPDAPGLMLGLNRGGSCVSAAYRVSEDALESELALLFRREMMTDVYKPVWVWLYGEGRRLPALTFVVDNTSNSLYAGRLPEDEVVRIISHASGTLGPCCDYLYRTVEQLRQRGITDLTLERLSQRVRNAQAGD